MRKPRELLLGLVVRILERRGLVVLDQRPRTRWTVTEILREELARVGPNGRTARQEILAGLVEKTAAGDIAAARLVFQYAGVSFPGLREAVARAAERQDEQEGPAAGFSKTEKELR